MFRLGALFVAGASAAPAAGGGVATATGVITSKAHGMATDKLVMITGAPAGITQLTDKALYAVVNKDANTFTLKPLNAETGVAGAEITTYAKDWTSAIEITPAKAATGGLITWASNTDADLITTTEDITAAAQGTVAAKDPLYYWKSTKGDTTALATSAGNPTHATVYYANTVLANSLKLVATADGTTAINLAANGAVTGHKLLKLDTANKFKPVTDKPTTTTTASLAGRSAVMTAVAAFLYLLM